MSFRSKFLSITTLLALVPLFVSQTTSAQNSTNAYQIVEGWAKLPGGRLMGAVGKAVVDNDGRHVWAVIRCDAPQEMLYYPHIDTEQKQFMILGVKPRIGIYYLHPPYTPG